MTTILFIENRLFRWCLNNVKLVEDRNNNWMPQQSVVIAKLMNLLPVKCSYRGDEEMVKLQDVEIGLISIRDLVSRGGGGDR